MHYTVKKKFINAKVKTYPFPYFTINNLLRRSDLKLLNEALPNFFETNNKNVYQNKSKSKITILPDQKIYKNLLKKKVFSDLNNSFKKLLPLVIDKFNPFIKKYINEKFCNSKLEYHISISIMKKGYFKSIHTDRRDHLVHCLFYLSGDSAMGGELNLIKMKKKQKIYDVFPDKKNTVKIKSFRAKKNFCIFTFNVPWAYHSVNKYKGDTPRKYLYAAYDFKIKNPGSKTNNRKKGYNINHFWKDKIKVKSQKRRKIFLSE